MTRDDPRGGGIPRRGARGGRPAGIQPTCLQARGARSTLTFRRRSFGIESTIGTAMTPARIDRSNGSATSGRAGPAFLTDGANQLRLAHLRSPDKFEIDFFSRAPDCAFFTFLRAAARCFSVAISPQAFRVAKRLPADRELDASEDADAAERGDAARRPGERSAGPSIRSKS